MKQSFHRMFITCLLLAFGLIISGCRGASPGNQQAAQPADVSEKTMLLSTVENMTALRTEDPTLKHKPHNLIVFGEHGSGVTYIAEKDGKQYVVHNGRPDRPHDEIDHLTISPDGRRVAYRCSLLNKQELVADGVAGLVYDNVRNLSYSPDSRHFSYLVELNGAFMLFLDGKMIEEGTGFSNIYYTANAEKLVYTSTPAGMETRLVVLDLKSGTRTTKEYTGKAFGLEKNTQRVALTVADGEMQRVIDFSLSSPQDVRTTSGSYGFVNNIAFGPDGRTVAFIGVRGTDNYLVVNGKEERLPGGLSLIDYPAIRPDTNDAAIVLATPDRYNRRYFISKATHNDGADKRQYDQIKELVYGKGNVSAYAARKGEKWCIVLNGSEGPAFDMIVTPVFSPDGGKLVYRARNNDKRFVVIADVKKNEHRSLPEYDVVSPTTFTTDGRSVAYGVKDGAKLIWKVDKL